MATNTHRPGGLYSNEGYTLSPSLEMNTIAPAVPKTVPVGGPKAMAFAIEKFENAHVTLFQAARDGRSDIVKNKLAKFRNKDINEKDSDNCTALHYAVRFNHVEIVKLLLKKGANPIVPGEDGATAIHYAARYKPSNVLKQSRSGIFPPPEDNEVASNGNTLSVAPVPETVDAGQDGEDVRDAASESILTILLKKSTTNINVQDNYGSTPLHYAAQKGNPRAIEELLKFSKVDVNAKDKQRATPLHEACTQGNPNVAKILIQCGAELQARDNEYMTPIHYAAMNERVDCVKVLVDAAESVGGTSFVEQIISELDRDKQTALHIAVDAGSRKTAQYLLFKGAEVNAVRMNMATPLHLAATAGDAELVELLLNFKANVEARNINHETPLHKAALFDSVPVIKQLLERGANIESRDKDNYTPLLVAVAQGNKESVSALLDLSANIRAKDSSDKTSIFIAAEENCVEVLELLLKNANAKMLHQESDKYDDTPLHIAAKKGFINIVRLLLDHGADIDAVNLEEQTPLHFAAMYGKENIVRQLIRTDGTIINDEDAESNTALHLASSAGHHRVIELLLDKGAIIDARNLLYWTPLDCAAREGWTKSAKVLLEYDAPVDPIDKCRVTPLHLAATAGHVDMVRLLIRHHADISLRDSTGRNALDMAVDEGHKSSALAILENENWRKAMRSRSIDRGYITTPLRKMIIKEPDLADAVFNKCVKLSDHNPDSHDFTVNLDYEFLEDIYAEWLMEAGDDMSLSSETNSLLGLDTASSFGPDADQSEYQSIEFKTKKEIQRALEQKKSHPLMLMVKYRRENLITHPLVVFLLDNKWATFGRRLFYIKLFLFLFFLLFLTGYVIMVTQNSAERNPMTSGNQTFVQCKRAKPEDSLTFDVFVKSGRYILLISACFHLLFELFQMMYERLHYFTDYTNFFEVIMYLATIIYVSADFDLSFVSTTVWAGASCSEWRVNVGALAIFLAWIVLVLFTRKFPMFGIYIVMFEDIFSTFLRFSVIIGLFTVAFGLGFYTMFFRFWPKSFSSPGASLLKTFVMVIGEFEFDSGFNEPDTNPPAFAYVLFVIFVIVMTILLMNLLVGLAVDDIKEVQAQASLKRQAMLVDLALNVEKAFPSFLRKRMIQEFETRHPNWLRERLFSSIDGETIREQLRQAKTPFEKIESGQEEVKDSIKRLKTTVTALNNRTEKIEMMLTAIVKEMKIVVNEDELDDEEHS